VSTALPEVPPANVPACNKPGGDEILKPSGGIGLVLVIVGRHAYLGNFSEKIRLPDSPTMYSKAPSCSANCFATSDEKIVLGWPEYTTVLPRAKA
jgi:hypothetical protein